MNPLRPILLVEDNPMDVDLTLRAFAKRNLANPVLVARDGEEAILRIEAWGGQDEPVPLAVLLDLKLPKINGLDVLRRIKEDPRFKTVPVVVLTTSAEDSDVRMAYQLGANSYIIKPVSFEKFIEVAAQIELYWGALNNALNDP